MRFFALAVSISVAGLAFMACSSNGNSVSGDQTTANVTAAEVAYGIENDESTSTSSSTTASMKPSSAIVTNSLTETTSYSGLESGTVSIARNTTWNDMGSAEDTYTGFISPDGTNNRYWQYYGTQTVTFSDYSNVSGRTITSGNVTTTISESAPGNFQSTTASSANGNDAYASGLPSNEVQHTVNNVNKTVTGTINVSRNGSTYTCSMDLDVDVISRVTWWTINSDHSLSNRELESRDTTISGTVTVGGTAYTVDTTLTKSYT